MRAVQDSRQIPLDLEPEHIWAVKLRLRAERAARNIGHSFAAIGTAIAALVAAGDTTPTEAQIGALAGYSSRTVRRAKVRLRQLGIVVSRRRGRCINGAWRRISSEYQLHLPLGPVLVHAAPASVPQHLVVAAENGPKGQTGRTSQVSKENRCLGSARPAMGAIQGTISAAQAQQHLARIRAERDAQRRIEWQRRCSMPPGFRIAG